MLVNPLVYYFDGQPALWIFLAKGTIIIRAVQERAVIAILDNPPRSQRVPLILADDIGPPALVSSYLGTAPWAFGKNEWVSFIFAATKRGEFSSGIADRIG